MKNVIGSNNIESRLREVIRDVPDFPKKGIMFKDITPLLLNGGLFQDIIQYLTKRYESYNLDLIVSVEARGFLLGSPLAYNLGIGLVPVRKKGKLPRKTRDVTYDLEYGQDSLYIHEEDISVNQKILIVDDVLATGGTVSGVIELVEGLGASVEELFFLMELGFLKGRQKLGNHPVYALTNYE